MIKVGVYASMFGKGDAPELQTVEGFVELASQLNLDVVDFRSDVGFGGGNSPEQLFELKMRCLRAGLPVGYLASQGHFVGTDEELQAKIDYVREDVARAVVLGTPLIRVFCGAAPADPAARAAEVRCFQESCDIAAKQAIMVGLQNHPCDGDNVLRLLEEVDRPNFTHILDTGQWTGFKAYNEGVDTVGDGIYRYMEQTAPHAVHVRAKFFKIDSGREEWLDYERIVGILREADFNGTMGVVFEGGKVNSCGDRDVLRLAVQQLRDLTS